MKHLFKVSNGNLSCHACFILVLAEPNSYSHEKLWLWGIIYFGAGTFSLCSVLRRPVKQQQQQQSGLSHQDRFLSTYQWLKHRQKLNQSGTTWTGSNFPLFLYSSFYTANSIWPFLTFHKFEKEFEVVKVRMLMSAGEESVAALIAHKLKWQMIQSIALKFSPSKCKTAKRDFQYGKSGRAAW